MVTLGSSRFAAAIGVSPYKSRAKLWRQCTGREPETSGHELLQWGVDNEHNAALAVSAVTSYVFDHVYRQQKWERGRYHATPDGDWGTIGLEVKCPKSLYDSVPDHYLPQVQGHCMVCGFERVIFGCWVLDGAERARVWEVWRSDEFIAWMSPKLEEFIGLVDDDAQPKRLSRRPVIPVESCQIELVGEI